MPDTSELVWTRFLALFFHTSCGNELQLRTVSSILGTGEKHPHTDPQKKNIIVSDNSSAMPVLEFATKSKDFSHN